MKALYSLESPTPFLGRFYWYVIGQLWETIPEFKFLMPQKTERGEEDALNTHSEVHTLPGARGQRGMFYSAKLPSKTRLWACTVIHPAILTSMPGGHSECRSPSWHSASCQGEKPAVCPLYRRRERLWRWIHHSPPVPESNGPQQDNDNSKHRLAALAPQAESQGHCISELLPSSNHSVRHSFNVSKPLFPHLQDKKTLEQTPKYLSWDQMHHNHLGYVLKMLMTPSERDQETDTRSARESGLGSRTRHWKEIFQMYKHSFFFWLLNFEPTACNWLFKNN